MEKLRKRVNTTSKVNSVKSRAIFSLLVSISLLYIKKEKYRCLQSRHLDHRAWSAVLVLERLMLFLQVVQLGLQVRPLRLEGAPPLLLVLQLLLAILVRLQEAWEEACGGVGGMGRRHG
eukprot:scaffold21691_cov48-Phaeocystis_antarctica.AAC.2